jgi:hypothetical protein
MSLEFQDAPGIHNPDWCQEQKQLVESAKARGWISFVPMSASVLASESPPVVNVATKKDRRPARNGKIGGSIKLRR